MFTEAEPLSAAAEKRKLQAESAPRKRARVHQSDDEEEDDDNSSVEGDGEGGDASGAGVGAGASVLPDGLEGKSAQEWGGLEKGRCLGCRVHPSTWCWLALCCAL